MQKSIDRFIRFLATERGLSDNYQLSVRQSLEAFAHWLGVKRITSPSEITVDHLTAYLRDRKKTDKVAASTQRVNLVALKIFFRRLAFQKQIPEDIAEQIDSARLEQYLPETLNEPTVKRILESIDIFKPLGRRDRAILELLYASGCLLYTSPSPRDRG